MIDQASSNNPGSMLFGGVCCLLAGLYGLGNATRIAKENAVRAFLQTGKNQNLKISIFGTRLGGCAFLAAGIFQLYIYFNAK